MPLIDCLHFDEDEKSALYGRGFRAFKEKTSTRFLPAADYGTTGTDEQNITCHAGSLRKMEASST